MTAVSRVAIVGSGVAGTAAAILLAEGGVEVDVFEVKPDLSTLGSGITLQGNALRVFDRLGVWEQVKEAGYTFDVLGLRAPGPDAQVIAEIPDAPTGGPEYPATAGMYRPDLARILADRATELGARIRYGTTVSSFTQVADRVDVTLSRWIDRSLRPADRRRRAALRHPEAARHRASSPSARAWGSGAPSSRARRTSRTPISTTAVPSTSPGTPRRARR